jgi:predicted ATPase
VVGIELRRLWVRNFKSLRDFSLDVPTRLNVVIGTNGSGKTALVEVFELWRDLVDYARGRVVNPFLKWWGYDRVVWRHDETLPIVLGLELFSADPKLPRRVSYEVNITGSGGQFRILGEILETERNGISLRHDTFKGILRIEMDTKLFGEFRTEKGHESLLDRLPTYMRYGLMGRAVRDLLRILPSLELKPGVAVFEIPFKYSLILDACRTSDDMQRGALATRLEFELMEAMKDVKTEILKQIKEVVVKPVISTEGKGSDNLLMRALMSLVLNLSASLLADAWFMFCKFVNGFLVIKEVNHRAVRSPQRLERHERLAPDASNFVPFLFSVTGGRVPPALEEAVKYAMPDAGDCRLSFDVTTDGRVYLRLSTADGVSLSSAAMPSGVLKTLIVETALQAQPTVVVIDEFENSLHPELQQFLMDELRNSGAYVFLTTHSTVPLDYVKSPSEVVVLRLEGGETKAYRLREEAREKLKRYGLTLSELVLSGLLEPTG